MDRRFPTGRGDKAGWYKIALGIWVLSTLAYIGLVHYISPDVPALASGSPTALLWTPLNSFIAARMFGLDQPGRDVPLHEGNDYHEVGLRPEIDAWFAPMPLHDYGWAAQKFREVELTKTKFTSVIKAEIVMFPLILLGGFMYWQFIWHTSQIPSTQFPNAQKIWPIQRDEPGDLDPDQQGGRRELDARLDQAARVIIGSGVGDPRVLRLDVGVFKFPLLAFYGVGVGRQRVRRRYRPRRSSERASGNTTSPSATGWRRGATTRRCFSPVSLAEPAS